MIVLREVENYVDVAGIAEVMAGSQYVHQMGLSRILLCRSSDGRLFAMVDICPHARQPLAGGELSGSSLTCPKHGARFDLETGQPLNGVSKKALHMLAVRIRGDRIEVCLP